MALFSRSTPHKEDRGKTFLIIDVENGSVATGLAHISAREEPKLFGEKRVHAPLMTAVDATALAHSLDKALEEALTHTSETAVYARNNAEHPEAGELSSALVFLHAPWSSLVRSDQKLRWEFDQALMDLLHRRIATRIDPETISYHPFGRAVAHGGQYISQDPILIANMTGEIIELLLADQGSILGRATMPLGHRTVLRTLASHGNLTASEADSALKVTHLHNAHPFIEPLNASAKHFADMFNTVAHDLLPEGGKVPHLIIINAHHAGDWLARALSRHVDTTLFTPGGTVRTLKARHLEPHVLVHPTTHDVPLMLETLFVHNAQHRS